MRKRRAAVLIAALLIFTALLSACGKNEPEFTPSVFEEDSFFTVDYDEVAGSTTVFPASFGSDVDKWNDPENLEGFSNFIFYNISSGQVIEGGVEGLKNAISSMDEEELSELDVLDFYAIGIVPMVMWDESQHICMLMVFCSGESWPNMQKFVVQIGQKSYVFSDCKISNGAGSTTELFGIVLNDDVIPFMKDLAEHQDQEMGVRITSDVGDMNFTLSNVDKEAIIKTYTAYDSAGGTSKSSMKKAEEYLEELARETGRETYQRVEVIDLYE